MSKKVKLEMTKTEFDKIIMMIEDGATMVECAEKKYADRWNKALDSTQKMFWKNKIDYFIKR